MKSLQIVGNCELSNQVDGSSGMFSLFWYSMDEGTFPDLSLFRQHWNFVLTLALWLLISHAWLQEMQYLFCESGENWIHPFCWWVCEIYPGSIFFNKLHQGGGANRMATLGEGLHLALCTCDVSLTLDRVKKRRRYLFRIIGCFWFVMKPKICQSFFLDAAVMLS